MKGEAMTDNKRLYFIPLIARAFQSDNPRQAMEDAFAEIKNLSTHPEYEEGFRQFRKFIDASLSAFEKKEARDKVELARTIIDQLHHDLATDTFDGDAKHKEILIAALRSIPGWDAEYRRIHEEMRNVMAPETPLEIEISKDDSVIGTYPTSAFPVAMTTIVPGRYSFRLSNGRVLWKGNITKEDLLWTFAFPKKDLSMAAKTEPHKEKPTRIIPLLDGEFIVYVFAGLEAGQIRIEHGENIRQG